MLTRPTSTCTGPKGHRNLVGDELVQWRATISKGAASTASKRSREEGGSIEELTAVAERVSAASGKVGRRRGIAGDLGGPRKKKASGIT